MKIGIDGGGSKTELILIHKDGTVAARLLAPGCNPSLVGREQAAVTLQEAVQTLLARCHPLPSPVTHTLLCMAGSPDFWQETATSLKNCGTVETATDAVPVLELATRGAPGLALHAGTGSFVILQAPDGRTHYAGGLGWRIGDPGSALDVGRRATARALAELQGWAEKSALSEALTEIFSTRSPSAITAALHRGTEPNQTLGAYAACVSRLAVAGDFVARSIVLDSATELLACAEAAARVHFDTQDLDAIPAGLSGPVISQPFVSEALQARTRLLLKPLAEPPIEGVRRLLLRRH